MLAYGKRRLLEIAIALACEPRVLLLDEPVAGVPAGEREELLQTVAALPADVSVLLIEHDMDLVFSFANRMTVLVNGAVLTEGDPDQIASDPQVKAVYLGHGEEASMSELLKVENLSAGYGEAVVLHDVSLTLAEGETLALLGRNGTGKTTLINTLAGATRQHGGSIMLGGVALHKLASHQRAAAGIGWVPQERNIFKSLTVHENLTAVERRAARPLWTPERVYEMFPRLAERKANLGTQLSGGEQQMLAVGRALVLNPRLLLLDEPLEGLAPDHRGGAAARDRAHHARGGPVGHHRRAASAGHPGDLRQRRGAGPRHRRACRHGAGAARAARVAGQTAGRRARRSLSWGEVIKSAGIPRQ